mmetsp:Transcript_17863/g.39604  ORF Transcript_17863/g.39604 Transcript_17863/m.39604 type:complete len:276 (-) Transcript_17863:441-1268(-)
MVNVREELSLSEARHSLLSTASIAAATSLASSSSMRLDWASLSSTPSTPEKVLLCKLLEESLSESLSEPPSSSLLASDTSLSEPLLPPLILSRLSRDRLSRDPCFSPLSPANSSDSLSCSFEWYVLSRLETMKDSLNAPLSSVGESGSASSVSYLLCTMGRCCFMYSSIWLFLVSRFSGRGSRIFTFSAHHMLWGSHMCFSWWACSTVRNIVPTAFLKGSRRGRATSWPEASVAHLCMGNMNWPRSTYILCSWLSVICRSTKTFSLSIKQPRYLC